MEDIKEIKADLKEVRLDVKELSVVMLRNTVSLEHHMARTAASEKRLEKVESYILGTTTAMVMSFIYFWLRR